MDSFLFKHIFSPLLLILSEEKRMPVFIPYQLNFCLLTGNMTEEHPYLLHPSLPVSILSGMTSNTGKGDKYPFMDIFFRKLVRTFLCPFAFFLAISPFFGRKYS